MMSLSTIVSFFHDQWWLALGVVIGLIALWAKIMQIPQKARALKIGDNLKVLDVLPLDAQRKLFLVTKGSTSVLVLLSPKQETLVVLPPSPSEASVPSSLASAMPLGSTPIFPEIHG